MMFTHERISDSIIRIKDITKTAMYLIIGEKCAYLIDTGCGIGDLRAYVDALIDVPYDVILTHGHVDHASGAAQFLDKNIYLHNFDWELMRNHTTWETRRTYAKHTKVQEAISDESLVQLCDFSRIQPLQDGQKFALGKRTLQIVHTPGHTKGMCMVLVLEDRTILFGDGCGANVILLDEYSTSVETYLTTLSALKKFERYYDVVLRNHGTYESSKDILDNVIACCRSVINHSDDHIPAKGLVVDYDDAFLARKRNLLTNKRIDGKEGNLIYRSCKLFDV